MQTLSLAVADIVAFVAISILVVSFGLLAWAAYTDFTAWGKTAMINKTSSGQPNRTKGESDPQRHLSQLPKLP